ncbi:MULTISPECIES: NAD(P)H-dependent oxidoreductase [Clostridium]|uniref:NADPH-dependent FMN reductase n=1 Tax=Clostridium ragsdalei P11 TaxID=1353534 RepID=A0A1A6AI14_9CLOT|nr:MULTISPECIES: NAD(P)H-dependent oxidoreductase [Clostridium]OBR89712.1 NADPH-dependent FMN reductase [Clostridium ragsdalei P11]QXE21021.1 hypothetical protein B5S50_20405 [Clostridium sp. 001]
MKILVINDSQNEDKFGKKIREKTVKMLKSEKFEFKDYNLNLDDLHYCIGCFNCWIKTPGICVFDDLGRNICEDFIKSDIVLYVGPIKYGCYSPVIKRALDRQIPNILPFFEEVNGEMHHSPRYDKYPELVTLGYGEDVSSEEEETFSSLVTANGINLQKSGAKAYVCKNDVDIDEYISDFESYLKGREVR